MVKIDALRKALLKKKRVVEKQVSKSELEEAVDRLSATIEEIVSDGKAKDAAPKAKRRHRRFAALSQRWTPEIAAIAATTRTYKLVEEPALSRQQKKRGKHLPGAKMFGLGGYVPVPLVVLRCYGRLTPRLTMEEAMLVLHVVDGFWGRSSHRVRYPLLRKRIGCSEDKLLRVVGSLKRKRNRDGNAYLTTHRDHQQHDTVFDFSGLFKEIVYFALEQQIDLKNRAWLKSDEAARSGV